MNMVELLTVTERFQLSGIGLTVIPDFSVPEGWRNLQATVEVVTPAGEKFEAIAHFGMTHFNIPGEPSIDKRWRILISLQDVEQERVPLGSRLFAEESVRDAVMPKSKGPGSNIPGADI